MIDTTLLEQSLNELIVLEDKILQIDKQFVIIINHKWKVFRHELNASYIIALQLGTIDYSYGKRAYAPFGVHTIVDIDIEIPITYHYLNLIITDEELKALPKAEIFPFICKYAKSRIKYVKESKALKTLYGPKA